VNWSPVFASVRTITMRYLLFCGHKTSVVL
jgi:hypothetical protein